MPHEACLIWNKAKSVSSQLEYLDYQASPIVPLNGIISWDRSFSK